MVKKRGQIWVETVIYTLIGLLLIGSVLAFITPKIQEIQDRAVIDQSISMLNDIEKIIFSISLSPGNKRILDIGLRKGNLIINSEEDKIIFEMESTLEYSQDNITIKEGDIDVLTVKLGSLNKITLTSNYNSDIIYAGKNVTKIITRSPTPYKLSIENKGSTSTIIDINVI